MNQSRMIHTDNSRKMYCPRAPPLSQPEPLNSAKQTPPEPPDPPANFIIRLTGRLSNDRLTFIKRLLSKCCSKSPPDTYFIPDSGQLVARLFFTEWNAALESLVALWESRLYGTHDLTPRLTANVIVPSDVDELNCRLRLVFSDKIRALVDGEPVKRWKMKVDELSKEIGMVEAELRKRHHSLKVFTELVSKKKGFESDKELILKRVDQFKWGLQCLLTQIHPPRRNTTTTNGAGVADNNDGGGGGGGLISSVTAFQLQGPPSIDWARVYRILLRECHRLYDALPIYAYRRDILDRVRTQQVMVLIGETGSGKSTQLVQYLADSGLVASGFLICTQPRKIAAISLARRVQEESYGCYEYNPISSHPYYSSDCQFKGRVMYMTDHCLLQHCMNDRNLLGVSCIVVDEAHERSLNTDLLLAMLKKLLLERTDLRLIIMSATADAEQISDYFYRCEKLKIEGRNFPVDVKYVPCFSEGATQSVTASADNVAPYVYDVFKMANEIHKSEPEGTILAFLTSPIEVEWACERFEAPNAEPLALHGKLSHEEQSRVFHNYPGKRKIIFATNVAETSLTIPGVKYVVDSGMAKESRFEPGSGMNVLRVCRISKSSANQRTGRAGRTEPGCCYRLYSQDDFHLMAAQPEPEIRRVHLGVAVLKIVALGVKNVRDFDFVDAPSPGAIDMAVQNLVQLGAVSLTKCGMELTDDGRYLVKLGIEPRLGKLILSCFRERQGKEGLILAAVMANSSSIFCRVGNQSEKLQSDRLKVSFCHADGDLFTLLSVYKAWESEPLERRNTWCWNNSINAKSMRRCHDTVSELEHCLKTELRIVVPSYWSWTPEDTSGHHKNLKRAILSSLSDNVAMFSGCDRLGYKVALTGQHVPLHPSSSLLMFNQKPDWVVFGEVLSASGQYLVCVTAFDREFLSGLSPPPRFDPFVIESQKLTMTRLSGFGKTVLKKFCGKSNSGLLGLVSRIREACRDGRIRVEMDVDNNMIQLFSSPSDVEKVVNFVKGALDCERRWLLNECMDKCLYPGGPGASPPVALFGSGAEIRHLELDRRSLTVNVYHPNVSAVDDKELLSFIENHASGICAVHKFTTHSSEIDDIAKWGSITFLTPDAAVKATELNNIEFNGSLIKVDLAGGTFRTDRISSYPAVKAELFWPRRLSKGFAIVKCNLFDVEGMVNDFCNLVIGERYVRCEPSNKYMDSVTISGIDRQASESEILEALRNATNKRILDFFLIREDAVDGIPYHACEEMLFKEISVFMPKGTPQINFCRVQVFPPKPKDIFMRALITFDGRLHLEAAKALEHIEGKILPGFLPWQKIQCQRLFHTSVSCPAAGYRVIKKDLESLVARFGHQKGVECNLSKNVNGSVRVKILAAATKIVTDVRKPFEELMKGREVPHDSLTPAVLQLLFSRDGISLLKLLEQEMGVYVLFDKQTPSLRIFGPSGITPVAEERLVQSLLKLHKDRQLEVHLRGVSLPNDLMKKVVKRFGPHLDGLKDMVPEAELILNTRHHVISVCGSKEAKVKVEEIVRDIAEASGHVTESTDGGEACPICLCEVEDAYQLESCMHTFCRSCLVEQCESAIRNKDGFPICCSREGCMVPIWLVDLKSLLSSKKLEELFVASVGAFVVSSAGKFRYCPSPDCPSVYQVAGPDQPGQPFLCRACYTETCTKCHMESHAFISCEKYSEYKEDPEKSLEEWSKGKDDFVKRCPVCGYTIEKAEGCNHVECKCGKHLCWACLESFLSSDECYTHLRAIHQGIS